MNEGYAICEQASGGGRDVVFNGGKVKRCVSQPGYVPCAPFLAPAEQGEKCTCRNSMRCEERRSAVNLEFVFRTGWQP